MFYLFYFLFICVLFINIELNCKTQVRFIFCLLKYNKLMTKLDFQEALNLLKNINSFKVDKHNYELVKNTVRINYENQIIKLKNYTLVFSGTLEQVHNKTYSQDKLFLAVALLDSSDNDLTFKPKQLNTFKNVLQTKILENV